MQYEKMFFFCFYGCFDYWLAKITTTTLTTDDSNHPYEDGSLIYTQLVKTGGADQGGLQVGDVFVEFGIYSNKNFPGLKSIAALVRRSATVGIPCVVWRKLETNGKAGDGNNNDPNSDDKSDNNSNLMQNKGSSTESIDDKGVKTIFQKLELKLTPLQSHDADSGGVLGTVINTWPLPEMQG